MRDHACMTNERSSVLFKKIAGATFALVAILLNLYLLVVDATPDPVHSIGGIAVGALLMVAALPLYLWADE